MDVPPEIAFRNIEPTDALKEHILQGIDGLDRVYDHLVSCRVMVEETNPGRRAGKLNHVRIDLGVPGNEIVINRNPPQRPASHDLLVAVDEAFDTARRRLIEFKRKQRGDVKTHELPQHGRVIKLLASETGEAYGFIESADGREIYFHQNSVQKGRFDDLEVGMEVHYVETAGDKGPQASAVIALSDEEIEVGHEEEVPLHSPGS